MPNETLIYDLPWARLLGGNNELKLRAKTEAEVGHVASDALMIRFQVPQENLAGSGWIGCIAADVLDAGGVERVQLKLGLKLDPDPVLECYATRPGSAGNDVDEVRIFRFGLDRAEFGVPLVGSQNAAPTSRVSRFYSDTGTYMINFQSAGGDLSPIVYRLVPGDDEGAHPIGRLPIVPL